MKEKTESKATAVGINHIALEVENIERALEFYGEFLHFEVKSKSDTDAFVYFGDQFINFMTNRTQKPDDGRHFGIAVDDKELVRKTLKSMGVRMLDLDGKFLDFHDPWGNRVEITTYRNIQFTKADHVLKGMGLENLTKTDSAIKELADKNMAP